jgi:surface polysaccharide O-acyltransferase-like enzyme
MAVVPPGRVASSQADTAWVSWARVLAIVAVVVVHTTASTAVGSTDAAGLAALLDISSIYAVPLFVMLSGALLLDPARYRGARDFWRRRALRLLPAIVFWHLWYLAVRVLRGDDLTAAEVLRRIVTGELYTQLYFLWIVLGLAVLTPALMPLVRRGGRRGAMVVGGAAAALSAIAAAAGLPTAIVQTAITWWIPYVGLYLLGWAFRETRLRGWALAICVGVVPALAVLLTWQWRDDGVPAWLPAVAPVSYHGALVCVYTLAVFLLLRALLATDGILAGLTRGSAAVAARRLGDATLGVFGLHLTVIAVLDATGLLGGNAPAESVLTLLVRVAVVVTVSYAVVLPLRRVPVVRAVL